MSDPKTRLALKVVASGKRLEVRFSDVAWLEDGPGVAVLLPAPLVVELHAGLGMMLKHSAIKEFIKTKRKKTVRR